MNALLQATLIAPSINVLGAYFPDWMLCAAGAVLLTTLVSLALAPTPWYQRLARPARIILHPALGTLLALLGWLLLFRD